MIRLVNRKFKDLESTIPLPPVPHTCDLLPGVHRTRVTPRAEGQGLKWTSAGLTLNCAGCQPTFCSHIYHLGVVSQFKFCRFFTRQPPTQQRAEKCPHQRQCCSGGHRREGYGGAWSQKHLAMVGGWLGGVSDTSELSK